ncbi:MAG: HEPN domain-containing protein [Phormidium sp. GEM2.Bin31]|nr:MAG: HEPN domain-containing protein [Phormidium sp. GEM2.Bin31]
MSPNTYREWLTVADERRDDALKLQQERSQSIASVYLAGYAIECTLKALLHKQGRPFPKGGREGHNLRQLWSDCGFQVSDLHDPKGTQTFYLQTWDTSLRYESKLPSKHGLETEDLIEGAKRICGLVRTKIRRHGSRRR